MAMFQRSAKFLRKAANKNVAGNFLHQPVSNFNGIFASQQNSMLQTLQAIQRNQFVRFYNTESERKVEEKEEETNEAEKETTQNEDAEETPEQKQIRELTEEVTKFKNAYATCLADQENTRRIARQDVKNATEYAVTKLGKSMVDVLDNLDRALNSLKQEDFDTIVAYFENHKDEEMKKKMAQVKSIVSGVKIIKKQMLKSLEGSGITPIENPLNNKFDPEFHEALMKQNITEGAKDKVGCVAHVLNTGYMIKDRILRPTKVVVYVDEE